MTQDQMKEAYQKYVKQQHEDAAKYQKIAAQAQETQSIIDKEPRRKYSIIVALDEDGSFAKDGKIPWYYPDDFKWFKLKTQEQICIMGKNTYLDINERLGEKAAVSVLPNRKNYVVSSTLKQDDIKNAIVIPNLLELDKVLFNEPIEKTAFFIGGGNIFKEAVAIVNEMLITQINKSYDCDQLFPTQYVLDHFNVGHVQQIETTPELRFVTYTRKP